MTNLRNCQFFMRMELVPLSKEQRTPEVTCFTLKLNIKKIEGQGSIWKISKSKKLNRRLKTVDGFDTMILAGQIFGSRQSSIKVKPLLSGHHMKI